MIDRKRHGVERSRAARTAGPVLGPGPFAWNARGMHQADLVATAAGRVVAAVDGHRATLSFGFGLPPRRGR